MKKLILCLLIAFLLLQSAALAEVYEGQTVALHQRSILAETTGTVSELPGRVGQLVRQGDVLVKWKPISVFSAVDGTVSTVHYDIGEESEGEVLQIMPQSTYLIYCIADKAYEEPDNQLLANGETLYVKCTKDGTHIAVGRVFGIDGAEYRLETTGGELYLGETVYLYRSPKMESASRVGIGTVVTADVEVYSSEGVITEMKVSEGDFVEKGQLLYRYLPAGNEILTVPQDGILTELSFDRGDAVQEGESVASLVSLEDIVIEITVPEKNIADFSKGMSLFFTYAYDRTEEKQTATVLQIASIPGESGYQVLLKPEKAAERLGLSVEVSVQP